MTTKKEHAVGSGIGASVGTIAGGVIGAVAGPSTTISAAAIGGMLGSQLGSGAADMLAATAHLEDLQNSYQDKSYYSAGRTRDDYAAAYAYGYQSQLRFRAMGFAEVEQGLSEAWPQFKQHSRLTWAEAREAVKEGWELGREQDARPPKLNPET